MQSHLSLLSLLVHAGEARLRCGDAGAAGVRFPASHAMLCVGAVLGARQRHGECHGHRCSLCVTMGQGRGQERQQCMMLP